MNPFILAPQERLQDWKAFRKNILPLSEEEQLDAVAKYFARAPLARIAYDAEQPSSWPSAWEMISDGEWCKNSVAIGMEFTLRLAGWAPDRLELAMLKDWDISDMSLVVIIDGTKVLNYTYASVSPYPETRHDILSRIRFIDKHYVFVG